MTVDFVGNRNLWDLLTESAARYSGNTALVCEDKAGDVVEFSYQQLLHEVRRTAGGFASLGVRKGDSVVLHLANCAEFIFSWSGLAWIGAVMVPTNTASTAAELQHVAWRSGAVAAVTSPGYLDTFRAVQRDIPSLRQLVLARAARPAEGTTLLTDLQAAAAAPPHPPVGSEDVVEMIFTSGTTSRPTARRSPARTSRRTAGTGSRRSRCPRSSRSGTRCRRPPSARSRRRRSAPRVADQRAGGRQGGCFYVTAVEHDGSPDWTEPGVFQVLPGVYRIPLPLPTDALRAVNVYVIENDGGLVLIDAGWALAQARELLQRMLGVLGCGLGDVCRFLITHIHRDHYTQAIALRREFGGRVGLGRGEQPSLRAAADPARDRWDIHVARLRRCGAFPVVERLLAAHSGEGADVSLWERPDEWIDGGCDIALDSRTLHALPTPGHTRGHLAFIDRDAGAVFAGDHVLPHITPSIAFEPAPPELPLRNYLESLRRVRELPDMRLLPAHGPVTGSVHARVDELLAHHDGRLEAAAGTVEAGSATSSQAAQLLTWPRRDRAFASLDTFNQMLAVFETQVHLDLLAAQGRLRRSADNGVTRYAPGGGPPGE